MGINLDQALDCFKSHDLIGIGMEADAMRRRLHPEGVVSYAVDAAVSCARLDSTAIQAEVVEAEADGATGVTLRSAGLDLDAMASLIASLKRRCSDLWLQLADPAAESLPRLRESGLDGVSVLGVDDASLAVHRAAHNAGLRSTAAMIFGQGESTAQLVGQLEAVRQLQEETGGFAAFVPLSFQCGRDLDDPTAVEYLKTLAISRMVLDTIDTIQSDWSRQGLKILQMGLRFGANDVGSVPVQQSKGATEEEVRRVIRDAGFQPAQRDLGFRVMMLG
jgi:cyclic dehypoxanthinyl futalosine synthase